MLSPLVFLTKILYGFLISPMRATCPANISFHIRSARTLYILLLHSALFIYLLCHQAACLLYRHNEYHTQTWTSQRHKFE